jgi:endonuclease/exonuclease/phosphatase family metal-dependent hydrolase
MSKLTYAMALSCLLLGCGQSAEPDATRQVIDVNIMTFNIEWGGDNVSFDNVVEAIRLAEADIVGVQEAEGNLERLAAALGWHADARNHVVSRFPLLDPPGGEGKYLYAEVTPGNALALANLHLPSDPYGPDMVRDGAGIEAVLANEHAARMPMLRAILDAVAPVRDAGYPLVVTGDFNSPTHTDWTKTMVGKRRFLDYAVDWPVSLAMVEAGFSDAWRSVYRDVEAKPGLTWWAGRPPLPDYAPGENDAEDRIDLVWYQGPVVPRSARLVGEPGGPGVDVHVSPWPSDHRGVVVTFTVEPRPLQDLLTSERRIYRDGDEVHLRAHFANSSTEIVVTEVPSNAVVAKQASSANAALRLPPGHYRAVATVGGRDYKREFWIVSAGTEPGVEVLGGAFASGQPVEVEWRGAPGHRFDYLGLYAANQEDLVEGMLAYAYTGSRPEGRLDIAAAASAAGMTLAPGAYVVRLMKDDGYDVLAESAIFEIRQDEPDNGGHAE